MMERSLLTSLDARSAQAFGEFYRDLSRELLDRAADLAAEQAQRAALRARRDEALAVWRAVEHWREQGLVLADAVDATARRLDRAPAELFSAWCEVGRREATARRHRRNFAIVRLAARGWTDAEIGRRTSLHPKTVNRIIGRAIRTAHGHAAAVVSKATAIAR